MNKTAMHDQSKTVGSMKTDLASRAGVAGRHRREPLTPRRKNTLGKGAGVVFRRRLH